MIPDNDIDSEVERLSRGFWSLQKIEGKVPARQAEEDSDVDSEEDMNEDERNNKKEEEPFPPDIGFLQSIWEHC